MISDAQSIMPTDTPWKVLGLPGFMGQAGPLMSRRDAGEWVYGLQTTGTHLNPAGVVHGGALATLMDHALSTVAWEACGRVPCITLELNTHFLSAVRPGQLVEARATVTRRTRSLVFMQGQLTVNGDAVLSAQAIMKVATPD